MTGEPIHRSGVGLVDKELVCRLIAQMIGPHTSPADLLRAGVGTLM